MEESPGGGAVLPDILGGSANHGYLTNPLQSWALPGIPAPTFARFVSRSAARFRIQLKERRCRPIRP